jgi:hypothetical protein
MCLATHEWQVNQGIIVPYETASIGVHNSLIACRFDAAKRVGLLKYAGRVGFRLG